jgi:hypothetical protein
MKMTKKWKISVFREPINWNARKVFGVPSNKINSNEAAPPSVTEWTLTAGAREAIIGAARPRAPSPYINELKMNFV